MPTFHSEPYLYLAGLSHKSVLIAWGAFYFKIKDSGAVAKLVDDDDLDFVHPPRRTTIGAASEPYGPATVEVRHLGGGLVGTSFTETANHCWVTGLEPDTEYEYTVTVKGVQWAKDERWDWDPQEKALKKLGNRYRNVFRTLPDPMAALNGPFTFAVIGDFGRGVRELSTVKQQQREVAQALATAVTSAGVRLVLTTGDNIYASRALLGFSRDSGENDDDWFFTYFQPYRYLLNQVPVYPSIGNHDTGESEDRDDRQQLFDNLHLAERLAADVAAGRASIDPGLFYRFRVAADVEFVCLDTSKESFFGKRLFEYPKHRPFVESSFPAAEINRPRWRIPFCHHPPFCAGPNHHNTTAMHDLLPLFERAGVRVLLSGHEHNFQHSRLGPVNYIISGGGARRADNDPDRTGEAHTVSWADACHFLLVTIDGDAMDVRVIGPGSIEVTRTLVAGGTQAGPIRVLSS